MKTVIVISIVLIANIVLFLLLNGGVMPCDNIFSLSFTLESNQLEYSVDSLKNDDSNTLITLSLINFKVTLFAWLIILAIEVVNWLRWET